MGKPLLDVAGCTCNGYIFLYQGHLQFLYAYIAIACAFLLYLLYKTIRLCNIAFSYSNFHVHQTYKLYALAFINLAFIILSRKSQLDYQNFYYLLQDNAQYQLYQPSVLQVISRGYEIVNDLFGIFSIYTNNFMHIYNSFTWLNIAFSCDYNFTKDSRVGAADNGFAELAQLTENQAWLFQKKKERVRKVINYVKFIVNYCLTLGMLVFTVLGTFFYAKKLDDQGKEYYQNQGWCTTATIMSIVATSFPLLVFSVAFFFYAKHLWDPQVSKITKVGLVYLLLVMFVRTIYFVVAKQNEDNVDKSSDPWPALAYTLLFTLFPIVVMSMLGEKQLEKEQYTLLRRSSIIFKSTII